MIRRLIRQDLAWAGVILLLAAAIGLVQHWRLVCASWTGGLPAQLEQMREQRRQEKFQGIKTLSLAQTHEIFQQGQALFIDARNPEEYAELHIPGAVNLSTWDLKMQGAQVVRGIAPERQIVVYCGQESCDAALQLAEKLQSLGYARVSAFLGGFRAWDEAGYPVETSK
jgi:rhodanese-related sulfurtransferase